MQDGQNGQNNQTDDPQPRGQGRDDAPAVQKTNRHEVEEVEKKSRVSQGAEHRVARRQVNQLANASAGASEQRTANADLRFDPGISRRLFKGDDGSHEWTEYRRAHLQSLPFGAQQMPTFMYENQQLNLKRKPGAPNNPIQPNCHDHRPAS